MKTQKARICVGHTRALTRQHTFLLTVCRKSQSPLAPSV
ncbi:hypothetical protein E2C01_090812 [Portunus trituberculatus]|uniref:Uncharacterized protein n=1 Tax=Portunus trituberculatus TaxID=210409 RepID=A0A5B7JTE3_PORTR|nr:hypothetical protein [Portunus trituberculatus]